MADPYHGLAADYDWLFDDQALAGDLTPRRSQVLSQRDPPRRKLP